MVQSISPNRLTARTASVLEEATGSVNVRTATSTATTGLDGTGVGIAVLDSGLMSAHRSFLDAAGKTRVRRAVNFL